MNTNLGTVMVLGSEGMVGSSVIRQLEKTSQVSKILPVSRKQVDMSKQKETFSYIASNTPDWLVIAAAKVGGIYANNTYPADFICENLKIQSNAIEGAFRAGVEKLIFLGSSCIYPKFAEQPIKEESLLCGSLEPTNEPYAIAKIAGIKLCESFNRQHKTDYRTLMPTNLYGPGDNYDSDNSHVIPGLLARIHEAKIGGRSKVKVWGTGQVRREFLYVEDFASAVVHIMTVPKSSFYGACSDTGPFLNVGTGIDITIEELATLIKSVVGYCGSLEFDHTQPDGTPKKQLDVSRIFETGWRPKTRLDEGLIKTYKAFVEES